MQITNNTVTEYSGLVRKVCHEYEQRTHLLDELCQEVWARALSKIDTYNDKQEFGVWLYVVAHSVGKNYLRAAGVRPETVGLEDMLDGQDEDEYAEEWIEAGDGTPEEWAVAEQTAEVIQDAFDATRLTWLVLYMHSVGDQSISEISSNLGIAESTVRTCLQRVREQIQVLIDS